MIRPDTEADLATAIRDANGPLRPRGGGTRPLGNPVEADTLDLGGLSGIRLYEPGALTMVARAGTPLAEVEQALAAEGQRLAFEPMDHRALMGTTGEPTVGGAVAANVSGPRRVQAGACRDFMLGVRFVDGRGEIVKNGGRVMKNVTGYDLVKLMTGSYGTLGALSEVSFKVMPAPEVAATMVWRGLELRDSLGIFCRALGSPFDVTGAARLPGDGGRTLIRVEGFAESVEYRVNRLAGSLAAEPDEILRGADGNAAIWRQVRDVTPFADRAGDVWRISVRPTDMLAVVEALQCEECVFDWGGGLVWACVEPGRDVRAALGGIGGHATIVRADDATRSRLSAFQPEPVPLARLSEGLRRKFDPRGILNPGLMG